MRPQTSLGRHRLRPTARRHDQVKIVLSAAALAAISLTVLPGVGLGSLALSSHTGVPTGESSAYLALLPNAAMGVSHAADSPDVVLTARPSASPPTNVATVSQPCIRSVSGPQATAPAATPTGRVRPWRARHHGRWSRRHRTRTVQTQTIETHTIEPSLQQQAEAAPRAAATSVLAAPSTRDVDPPSPSDEPNLRVTMGS
jgi:hypothetical protein